VSLFLPLLWYGAYYCVLWPILKRRSSAPPAIVIPLVHALNFCLSPRKIPYSYFYLRNNTPAEHSSAISHFQICRGMLGRRVLLIDDSCSTDPPPLIFQYSVPAVPCVHVFLASDFFTHHLQACMLCRPSSVFQGRAK
jgi:hypothetical protein